MIKVLLFAMPDITGTFDLGCTIPNLGMASLAGNTDPGICKIKVADLVLVRKKFEKYVLDLLNKETPDLIGLSCMSFQYHSALKLAKLIKSYNDNILIALGGYHPTLMFEEISASKDSTYFDFIVRGEGEATFNELVSAINDGKGYGRIAGLSYKQKGVFFHNQPRGLLSLDNIQLPDRGARLITRGFHIFGLPADAIETSRGCTNSCKFCSIRSMYGRSFRKYKISRIIADIRDAKNHGARALMVMDDNITLDLERLEMICDEIISEKLNSIHYHIQATVKGIAHSEKLVRKMADAGVKMVYIGIERASKPDLDFLGKKTTTLEDTRKAVKYLRDNGIICIGGFILGEPNDDKKALWDIFDIACDLEIDFPVFTILTPFVKTEIREELISKGLVVNTEDFSTYTVISANIRTEHLTSEEIEKNILDMYDAYRSRWSYIKNFQVRKIYPAYFWKMAAKQTANIIKSKLNTLFPAK